MNAIHPTEKPFRLYFLDLLRVFAFASVLIGHNFTKILSQWAADTNIHVTFRTLIGIIVPLVHGGGAGVVVFFLFPAI